MILNFPSPEDFPGCDPTGFKPSDAAIAACIKSVGNGGTIMVPATSVYLVTQPVSLFGVSGLRIIGTGKPDARPQRQRCSEFLWGGPAGADSVFSLNGSRFCELVNLSIDLDVPNPPTCAVRLDKWNDPVFGTPASINTRNTVKGCVITAPIIPAGGSGGAALVDISRTSPSNGEFMVVEDCIFSVVKSSTNYGKAILVGPTSNSYSHTFRRCSFTSATIGIHLQNGSATIDGCTGNGNNCSIVADQDAATLYVRGCNFEHELMALRGSGNFMLESNRWTFVGAGPIFDLKCRNGTIRRNVFLNANPASNPIPAVFAQNAGDFRVDLDENTWGLFGPLAWEKATLSVGPREVRRGF
jgi:hypothetical protein